MSNPDFPSCLLPSAKCGWGHAECSLLCRPDGSCKIEQFCLLKHQLFSKISISSHIAVSRPILRARRAVPASLRSRGHLPAEKLWKMFAAVPVHRLSCRNANPGAPYGLSAPGSIEKGFSSPQQHWPTLLATPLQNREVKCSFSLVRYLERQTETGGVQQSLHGHCRKPWAAGHLCAPGLRLALHR